MEINTLDKGRTEGDHSRTNGELLVIPRAWEACGLAWAGGWCEKYWEIQVLLVKNLHYNIVYSGS